ncbi:RNA 2',3'-cyclic phosphodiesterase [Aestuariicella hydrocarbonica]|uniref:RNA 2',3'-cyclic phosphodiesterase n=1 Tax=Pseudomaricurvus hydrocarbonicus TaxID=1470433 RepID=A0A9E5JRE7_9GAMM|nr:RNA 2',3'-cyclic phosphodiesterase [Aestuariicella hydrocarbonica]NHO65382.1 RNA 2',3'-cyclic phosphodiesterase [Aestuariicella hydrocarbonica]
MANPAAASCSYPYRAFLGITVTAEANQQLNAWVSQYSNAVTDGEHASTRNDLRWVKAENRHITLNFLGDIHQAQERRLSSAFDAATAAAGPSLKSFTVQFEKLVYLGGASSPVLAAICTACSDLSTLQNWTTETVKSITGCSGRQRPYIPHITLARHRKKVPTSITMPTALKPQTIRVTVSAFALFKSELKNTGSEYTVIKRWPLL